MKGKELWIFTLRFPFGNGEAFLESELRVLAQGFDRVRLIPLIAEGEARPLPSNVTVERLLDSDRNRSLGPVATVLEAPRLLSVLRTVLSSAPSSEVRRKERREVVSRIRQALRREHLLVDRLGAEYDPQRVVLYSYWAADWATVLGLWRLRDPRVHFICRMQGFDLYDHRTESGWQQFQAFHVQQAERIFCVARAGLEHVQARYPEAAAKFRLSHMATDDHGPAPWRPDPVLRIISCSNLVPLKRVHLIAEALQRMEIPVEWTHFGDGPERARVAAAIALLPAHIQAQLKGSVPNSALLEHYGRHPFDMFVHMSSTEGGAPVAIQEAIGFGIPVIAADAGGTRDVVTEVTGITLPNAATPEMLAQVLGTFRASRWYDPIARAEVRAFWSQHFNAVQVHGAFLQELKA
ncbi:MAG TPA: glycosyltransferase [Flavobacteriales bacterium]